MRGESYAEGDNILRANLLVIMLVMRMKIVSARADYFFYWPVLMLLLIIVLTKSSINSVK